MGVLPSKTVVLFDRFVLTVPKKWKCLQDGLRGRRVVFITDRAERVLVSFEENMQPPDMPPESSQESAMLSFQCSKDGKYIHQRRIRTTEQSNGAGHCAYFYMKLHDINGEALCLPGQMVVEKDYLWTDGIEPILMELLDGLRAC